MSNPKVTPFLFQRDRCDFAASERAGLNSHKKKCKKANYASANPESSVKEEPADKVDAEDNATEETAKATGESETAKPEENRRLTRSSRQENKGKKEEPEYELHNEQDVKGATKFKHNVKDYFYLCQTENCKKLLYARAEMKNHVEHKHEIYQDNAE